MPYASLHKDFFTILKLKMSCTASAILPRWLCADRNFIACNRCNHHHDCHTPSNNIITLKCEIEWVHSVVKKYIYTYYLYLLQERDRTKWGREVASKRVIEWVAFWEMVTYALSLTKITATKKKLQINQKQNNTKKLCWISFDWHVFLCINTRYIVCQ